MRRKLLAAALFAVSAHANAVLECGNDTYNETGSWYVGQATNTLGSVDTVGDVWCYATGNELAYVQQHVTGLRLKKSASVVYWEGEDASFLIDNLQ